MSELVKDFNRLAPSDWPLAGGKGSTFRFGEISSQTELLRLWQQELEPYLYKAWWAHTAGGSRIVNMMVLQRKLTKLVGAEDANTLLSNLRAGSELASLGPVS